MSDNYILRDNSLDNLAIKYLVVGKAYAKPIVEKKPNKTSYEIGGNVTLSCHVEGTTLPLYDIKWHKLLPNGKFKPLKTEESVVKSILMLTGLSGQNEGTYKCTIFRSVLRYSASALVNINVKGIVNFMICFIKIIIDCIVFFRKTII